MAFAQSRPGALYYELVDQVAGWEKPRHAIVFHHGIGASAALWAGWLPHLAERYRVVSFDMRGCGRSHIPAGDFACNIGDLMMRWSNDRWVSTLHRVGIPPPESEPQDRISLVFFTNPNPDAEIRCIEQCVAPGETPKYPPVQVSEHYLGKLMRAGHSKVDARAADALTS